VRWIGCSKESAFGVVSCPNFSRSLWQFEHCFAFLAEYAPHRLQNTISTALWGENCLALHSLFENFTLPCRAANTRVTLG
jgi:hypothetical protein